VSHHYSAPLALWTNPRALSARVTAAQEGACSGCVGREAKPAGMYPARKQVPE